MASPAQEKPLLNFRPLISTIGIEPNAYSLPMQHTLLTKANIPEKLKAISLITFAQYAKLFNNENLKITVVNGPNERNVVIINQSNKDLKVRFEESSETIYYEEQSEFHHVCQIAGLKLFIFADGFHGKAQFVWTKAMIDKF